MSPQDIAMLLPQPSIDDEAMDVIESVITRFDAVSSALQSIEVPPEYLPVKSLNLGRVKSDSRFFTVTADRVPPEFEFKVFDNRPTDKKTVRRLRRTFSKRVKKQFLKALSGEDIKSLLEMGLTENE